MSAAIAIQRVAIPSAARVMKAALTASEKKMFWRMIRSTRREWPISHGSLSRSSDINAMSAVSIAASVPAAPIAIPVVAVAKAIEEGGDRRRGLIVGFALTGLQRRLASSPEAIYRSLQRRRERLKKRLLELEAIADGTAPVRVAMPEGLSEADLDDFDFDDYDDVELEEIEDDAIDQATAAATVPELRREIAQLGTLEELAAAVRASGTDKKWEELSSILQSDAMTAPDGTKRKLLAAVKSPSCC